MSFEQFHMVSIRNMLNSQTILVRFIFDIRKYGCTKHCCLVPLWAQHKSLCRVNNKRTIAVEQTVFSFEQLNFVSYCQNEIKIVLIDLHSHQHADVSFSPHSQHQFVLSESYSFSSMRTHRFVTCIDFCQLPFVQNPSHTPKREHSIWSSPFLRNKDEPF